MCIFAAIILMNFFITNIIKVKQTIINKFQLIIMKELSFKSMLKFSWIIILAGLVTFTSCKKDDDEEEIVDPVVVLDGLYVKGDAVAYTDFNEKAIMTSTKNEVGQADRAELMELYIPVKAGGGFNIVMVKGSANTTYGPGADFAKVDNPTGDEPHSADFSRGSIEETSDKFTVAEDGMYHVIFDTEVNKVVVAKVEWGLIGAATPNGWGGSTDLVEGAFNATAMSWTTSMDLLKGEFKLRYSNGWKIEIDTTYDNGTADKGIKVNTNYGGAVDALVPGGANIVNDDPGVYDVTMEFELGKGFTLTLDRTGDLPSIDYSNYEMAIIGSAYYKADGTQAAWDEDLQPQMPVVSGTDYTWTYSTFDLIAGGEFKWREAGTWSGKSIGFGDVVWAGDDLANFTDNGGNILVGADGNYTIELKIEAATEVYTVTVTKH